MTHDSEVRPVFRAKKVAEILDVDISTVYKLLKKGELAGHRVGSDIRVFADSVVDFQNRTAMSVERSIPMKPVRRNTQTAGHKQAMDTLRKLGCWDDTLRR